jgi:hypothetical protein
MKWSVALQQSRTGSAGEKAGRAVQAKCENHAGRLGVDMNDIVADCPVAVAMRPEKTRTPS